MAKVLGQVLGYLFYLALVFLVFAWAWVLLPAWAQPLVLAQALAISLVRQLGKAFLKAKAREHLLVEGLAQEQSASEKAKKAQELAKVQALLEEFQAQERLQAQPKRK